jgi:hypothetical protein
MTGPNVVLIQSAKQMLKEMAKIGVYPKHKAFPKWEEMTGADGMTWELDVDDVPYWVVGIARMDNPINTVSTIVHEAVHVWQGYAAYIGEENASREFEAYSIQSITSVLMSQYRAPRGV